MKKGLRIKILLSALFGVIILFSNIQSTYAQTTKKSTVRLRLQYVKIMNGEVYFDLKASARIDRKNVNVSNIDLGIYNIVNEDDIFLGKITTDMEGVAKLVLDGIQDLKADSTNIYNIKAVFKGNDAFKKVNKSLQFKDADIDAKLITKDSVNYITATLTDKSIDSVIENEALGVQVERLFMPYQIKEFEITDENGTIIVPIEEGIPGIDGKLNLEILLKEHDDFGTVKAVVVAPIGKPIVDESDFDERTMWSPRNKTPIFLLIFPNLLIFGMWGLIVYLTMNLYKITKS